MAVVPKWFPVARKGLRPGMTDVQKLINIVSDSRLVEDGLAGPATIKAYQALTGQARLLVDDLIEARSVVMEDITSTDAPSRQFDKALDGYDNRRLGNTRFYVRDFTHGLAGVHKIRVSSGAQGIPPEAVIDNLTELAVELEKLWDRFPGVLVINSGYRACTSGSAHCVGMAADIKPRGDSGSAKVQAQFAEVAAWARANLKFDQLISEINGNNPRDNWLHFAVRRPNGQQRGDVRSMKQFGAVARTTHQGVLFDYRAGKVVA